MPINVFVIDDFAEKICIKNVNNLNYSQFIKKIESAFKIDIKDHILKFNNEKFTEHNMSKLKDNSELRLILKKLYDDEGDINLYNYDKSKVIKEGYVRKTEKINTAFIENEDEKKEDSEDDEDDEVIERKSLSGILNICLLKYISRDINDNILKKLNPPIKEIIQTIKNEINFKNRAEEDIKAILNDKSGNNIFEYCKYLNSLITKEVIDSIIELFDDDAKKKKFYNFWDKLMKFDEFNAFFENELENALKNSYFDYSVISIVLYEKSRRKKYLKERNKCPNCMKRVLFHGTQIDPISNIVTNEFKYTRKAFYGMGIYFSDMLDYIGFYAGGTDYDTRRNNWCKIIPIQKTFSCVAAEIYYDEKKLKNIYDFSLRVPNLDHFPTYEEIESKYKKEMVAKNGIHLAKVEPSGGQVVEEINIPIEEKKGNFIGNEYAITEMDQMFPLYGLTLQRNEYFVVWRDNHFGKKDYNFSQYLAKRKLFLNKTAKMNVYFENTIEDALRIIARKKYNKIILISNIGLDLSGKKFVEIARKILGFDVMVLFFSANKKHFNWLKNFNNALYTDNSSFYEKYVLNYNKKGLKDLKNSVENNYNIKFPNFTNDFLKFPKFINGDKTYKEVNFSETCEYFTHARIYNSYTRNYINMSKEGKITLTKDNDASIWDITLDNGEITLFSNNFYLYLNDDGNLDSKEFMEIGKFQKMNEEYAIYFGDCNLSIETSLNGDKIIFKKTNIGNYEKFLLIDDV